MEYFSQISKYGHEQVVFCHDKTSGLKAVIAIHNTILGPSLGGLRMWPYKNESEAVEDALRLSRGMTYKNAAAGLNIGGGKAVIIGDSKTDKSEALFRAFGQFVDSLGGRYITAEDVGTCVEDMEMIKLETDYVSGLPEKEGGGGDPSPYTAQGTFEGIKIAVKHRLKRDDLKGVKVAVQGLGHVGYYLCKYLSKKGAELIVCDIDEDRVKKVVKKYNATAVGINDIYGVNCDVFAPCALGAVINDETIDTLTCSIVAGASNNQLLDDIKHGEILKKKNILYAPDYIINAGGVINVYYEAINQYNKDKVSKKVDMIYNILDEIFKSSKEANITTSEAAAKLSEDRINNISGIHNFYRKTN